MKENQVQMTKMKNISAHKTSVEIACPSTSKIFEILPQSTVLKLLEISIKKTNRNRSTNDNFNFLITFMLRREKDKFYFFFFSYLLAE